MNVSIMKWIRLASVATAAAAILFASSNNSFVDGAGGLKKTKSCELCLKKGGTWQPEANKCTKNCDIQDISCFSKECPENSHCYNIKSKNKCRKERNDKGKRTCKWYKNPMGNKSCIPKPKKTTTCSDIKSRSKCKEAKNNDGKRACKWDANGSKTCIVNPNLIELFQPSTTEQSCINSGGTVSTSMCCKGSDDFPNTCLIGACGCSPDNSKEVKTCDCPSDTCFNGNVCAPTCEKCPYGFFDGCNECMCTESGEAGCTRRTCSTYEEPKCYDEPPPATELSCDTCPNGYYDGCNTCSCDGENGGMAACTLMACDVYEEPYCLDDDKTISCDTCSSGQYYDGCNTCTCNDDGTTLCTLMSCDTYDEPYCIDDKTISCDTCSSRQYYDGCNTCMCNAAGQEVCTTMSCDTYDEPYCLDDKTISCDKCPYGYFDGCNMCTGCNENGLAGCTMKFCSDDTLEEPYCLDDNGEPLTPDTISCDVCPLGYYDGCNNCGCETNGETTFCTEMACDVYEYPFCN